MEEENIPEVISVECLRVPHGRHTPETIEDDLKRRTIDEKAQLVLRRAMQDGTETVWDRHEKQQPACKFCSQGISCQRCAMGPCRIMGGDRMRGVCGADADLMVSRNLLDTTATGAAAHSDHGREVVEAMLMCSEDNAPGYEIVDEAKLKVLADEYGVDSNRDAKAVAKDLALAMLDEFGTVKGDLTMAHRAPQGTVDIWMNAGLMPRSIDREIVEAMHRVHMGVGAAYDNITLQGVRASLGDGWGGSMMGTEISDVLFGTPGIKRAKVNLAVLKEDYVNVSLHGHNPVLSEMVVKASEMPEMKRAAEEVGAKGINLVGLCCTGNELLMRKGIPQAGNHLNQELVIATGACEVMIVDYQCIFPTLTNTASCYHTKVVTTSPKSKIPGAYHYEVGPENALEQAERILRLAIENYPNRVPERVVIPKGPMEAMVGFSVEAIRDALGGTFKPLVDLILDGTINGCAAIVGCNNPKIKHDYGHVTLARELIKRDILVVETGCAAIACGKAGLMLPEAKDLAGPGLGAVCGKLGIPPVLHMGSCVDCSRILVLAAELAKQAGTRIDQLPVAGAAPEWYSPKAVSIATYYVASGVSVCLGVMPKITGSENMVELLTEGIEGVVGAKFWVEEDPKKAAAIMFDHIMMKRKALGI